MLESRHDMRRRLTFLALVLGLLCMLIILRLFQWQVVERRRLAEDAIEIRDQRTLLEPPRGEILDRQGHPLAFDIYEWEISISPSLVDEEEEADLARDLAPLVGWTVDDLLLALQDKEASFHVLDRHAPYDVGLGALKIRSPALRIEPRPRRVYPEGALLSHVLGFVNDTRDGFYGVEGYYNQWLKGEPGVYRRETFPDGSEIPFGPIQLIPPKPGRDLILTLDRNIQLIVWRELADALALYGATSGTVVVMEPRSGSILASVSLPDYDPNAFSTIDPELFTDPAISKQYEPGSIFKILTWGGGLDAAIIGPETVVQDDGRFEVGGRLILNYDFRAYGQVTIRQGLVKSLNTVAAQISTMLRKERFYTYLRRFGIGDLTRVDLDSESPGRMRLPGDSDWYPSDLGTNAFGQGIAVTPMQMVAATAAVANGGLLVRPHVLAAWKDGEQTAAIQPSPVRQAISPEAAAVLTQMLASVVEEGATEAQVPGYRMAGKTGTAEIPIPGGYHPDATIASFVGWGPVDDPAFVILVKLDKPTSAPWGSRTAAPTFSRIAQQLFAYLQIPPDHLRVAQQ
jgi:cell division protein FtsI/penicillin-binding protein 2